MQSVDTCECPICLDYFEHNNMVSNFECTHKVCIERDTKCSKVGLNKCPMCRAKRIVIVYNDNREIDNEFDQFMDNYYSNSDAIYFTNRPMLTFFKVIHRRHSKFSLECLPWESVHQSQNTQQSLDYLQTQKQNKNNCKKMKSQMRQQKSFGKR